MKTKVLILLVPLCLQMACQQKTEIIQKEVIDFEKEEEAIKEVIIAESRAFWAKDYRTWADQWAHEDYVRVLGWWERGGVYVREGWGEISADIKSLMERNPEPNPQNEINKNYNIRISKTMAWVTFDQYGSDTGEVEVDMPGKTPNTRVLEKVNGKWKIVYVGWLLEGTSDENEGN